MNGKVQISLNDQTVEIEPDVWDVFMRAINFLVDTGDIALIDASIGSGLLARAKMASGTLRLTANPLPARPASPAAPR